MTRAVLLPWCLLGFLLTSVASRAQAPVPAIAFEENAVVASGLAAGKTVVWFGVELQVDAEYSTTLVRREDLGTAAADGTARLELGRAVTQRSVWVAVDLETGSYAVAAPPGYRVSRPQQPLTRLGANAGAAADDILDDRPYVMGLVVRPGQGAWAFAGGDGGPRDLDGLSDGHVSFALDQLDPLPGSPAAPAKSAGGDLWFVVDPDRMEISVSKGGVAQ